MQYLLFRSLFLPRILFVYIYSLISNAHNIYVEREREGERGREGRREGGRESEREREQERAREREGAREGGRESERERNLVSASDLLSKRVNLGKRESVNVMFHYPII